MVINILILLVGEKKSQARAGVSTLPISPKLLEA